MNGVPYIFKKIAIAIPTLLYILYCFFELMQRGFGGAQMFPLPFFRTLKQHEHISLTERCNKMKLKKD